MTGLPGDALQQQYHLLPIPERLALQAVEQVGRQHAQELLKHQQLQDLLLGVQCWPQPLAAQLSQPAQGRTWPHVLLVPEASEELVRHLRPWPGPHPPGILQSDVLVVLQLDGTQLFLLLGSWKWLCKHPSLWEHLPAAGPTP